MGPTFTVVGVKECVAGQPIGDVGEFPCEVVRITHSRAHALAVERRHLVGGVANQEHVASSECVCHRRMKPVHGGSVDVELVGRAPGFEQFRNSARLEHFLSGLALSELELPTSPCAVPGYNRHNSLWVAVLLGEWR